VTTSRTARRWAGWLAAAAFALLALVLPVGVAQAQALPASAPQAAVAAAPAAAPLGAPTSTGATPVFGAADVALHTAVQAGVRTAPVGPSGPKGPKGGKTDVTVKFNDVTKKPSTPILVLLGLTLLSLVPAILLTCTSFTKVLVVLSLTRNALGLQQIPPNQVLAGLALFLSLFIMSPVLTQMNHDGVQPYLHGTKSQEVAFQDGVEPLREFMLKQTGPKEIALLTNVAHRKAPAKASDVSLTTLIPAFILSELREAFIIGFMIFIPFLVIDIVVSAGLMSLGMMMMPPVMVSLPFKILLFVLVDGWGLIIKALVQSYGGG
jgi:flagellar biosynthetic protein FliP